MTELDLRLDDWASVELKSVAADFYPALILFCKIVLTNEEEGGFEAWRALVNKYEPTSKASVVGKLAQILHTPFDGDLQDAITIFERKIMIFEAQSRETICDSSKIGCAIAGMGQNSVREHLLMSATKCDSWTNFVRVNQSSTRGKPSLHRHRWKLMHFKETAISAGNTDTLRWSVGIRAMEGQKTLNVRNVERNVMDSVGHGATHHPTKTLKQEDGKVTEKETAQKGGTVKGGKGGNQGNGKGKGKKGQRFNDITEPPEEQWTGGSWEQWSQPS